MWEVIWEMLVVFRANDAVRQREMAPTENYTQAQLFGDSQWHQVSVTNGTSPVIQNNTCSSKNEHVLTHMLNLVGYFLQFQTQVKQ